VKEHFPDGGVQRVALLQHGDDPSENGRQGKVRHRLGSPPDDPARSEQDLTPADIRLGPADLEMLDALITTGTAASRAEAVGWVLARIRERPAYARLSERTRELDELKARF
jgi:hypothetical protein